MSTQLWAIILVIVACLIGSFGTLFLKRGSAKFTLNPFKLIKNYDIILGIFCYAIGTIFFIPALKGGDLSVLYPLVATTYIWVIIWSRIFLKEKITKPKLIGLIIIILGISLIGIGS